MVATVATLKLVTEATAVTAVTLQAVVLTVEQAVLAVTVATQAHPHCSQSLVAMMKTTPAVTAVLVATAELVAKVV